jgi:hypothetical protein
MLKTDGPSKQKERNAAVVRNQTTAMYLAQSFAFEGMDHELQ